MSEAPKKAEPVASSLDDIDPDIREAYGDDLINVISQIADSRAKVNAPAPEAQPAAQPVTEEFDVSQSNKLAVEAKLNESVDNWEQLNGDDGFLAWLAEPDVYSEVPRSRQESLQTAADAGNSDLVVAIFKAYQLENAAVTVPVNQAGERIPIVDSQQLVTPGNPAGSRPTGAPRGKRTYTRADISGFYSDVQKGRYNSKPADKKRIEKDIVDAASTGRIVG